MISRGNLIRCLVALCAAGIVSSIDVNFVTVGPFSFSDVQLPWAEARDACIVANKTLISIDKRSKDEELASILFPGGTGTIIDNSTIRGQSWTSGIELQEGVWHWDSIKTPFYYTRWFVGQPDDLTDLNCAYLATSGFASLYWRDANCSAPMYFICE